MAIPLRDSWLARALDDGGGRDFSPRTGRAGFPATDRDATRAPDGAADAALVERLRRGDATALTEIIAATAPALIRYATRLLHDDAEADDVVQDVLARLWGRRATVTVATTVRAYLFGAVRNAALNIHKHRRIVATHASMRQDSHVSPPADTVFARITVEQLLAHLSERRREAVVLRYLGELSYAEIGSLLGTTPVNAERLVARALETLKGIAASQERL